MAAQYLDLDEFQQFQSIVEDVSGVLTGPMLSRYWGRFFKAYGMQNCPDTMLTSMGVTNAHVENSDGMGRWDISGKPFVVSEGYDMGNVPFVFNGKKVNWLISAYMPSNSDVTATTPQGGRLWGLKLRDQNIRRYLPPMLPQGKQQAAFGAEVEFLYPLGGPFGIFKPYHNTSGKSTNYQEAPFYRHLAFAPKFLPGIKLTSLNENL